MTVPHEEPSHPDAILDLPALEELLSLDDGATGLLVEMAELFREDAPLRIAALKAACVAGDAHTAGEAAHALKGAAGTLGSVALRALAGDAERLARQGDVPAILGLLPALEASYPVFLAAVDAFIQDHA